MTSALHRHPFEDWQHEAEQPAEADGAREVGGGLEFAFARHSLAGALMHLSMD